MVSDAETSGEAGQRQAEGWVKPLCPCCGQAIAAPPPDKVIEFMRMTKQQRAIAEAVLRAHPRRVPIDRIVDRVWGDDPDGGPEAPERIVHTVICKLNHRLQIYGWRIDGMAAGRGSGYGLIPV